MGFRTVAGDARNQATNFTHCSDFWNVFKIEAAVYPIDDNFNMCKDEAFYPQADEESIDCAYTEKIGWFIVLAGSVSIMAMHFAWLVQFFVRKNDSFKEELRTDCFEYDKFSTQGSICIQISKSIKNSLQVVGLLLTPIPLPKLDATQSFLKSVVLFLISPVAEALDIVLDGIYIVRLARVLNRFWIKAKIIKLMFKLYIVAAVKDVIFSSIILFMFFRKSMDLTPQKNFQLNFIVKFIGFFTEDTAQSVLQYFYFEKYQMDGDIVIIFKFVIGLVLAGKSFFTLYQAYDLVKDKIKKIDYITASMYLLVSTVPVFRLIGLMIQASKRGSMIRAGCLEYEIRFSNNRNIREIEQNEIDYHNNYQWDTFYLMGRDQQKFYNENNATYKRLNVTPFNKQCLTRIDYCYLIGKFEL